MVKELFFSGYCRAMDGSRVVEVEMEDGELWADCAWPDCPHASCCPVAQKVQQTLEGEVSSAT